MIGPQATSHKGWDEGRCCLQASLCNKRTSKSFLLMHFCQSDLHFYRLLRFCGSDLSGLYLCLPVYLVSLHNSRHGVLLLPLFPLIRRFQIRDAPFGNPCVFLIRLQFCPVYFSGTTFVLEKVEFLYFVPELRHTIVI